MTQGGERFSVRRALRWLKAGREDIHQEGLLAGRTLRVEASPPDGEEDRRSEPPRAERYAGDARR